MTRKLRTCGIDNVLVDLGFDDAEELSVKAMLAMKLNALLEAQGLTQSPRLEDTRHAATKDFGDQKL